MRIEPVNENSCILYLGDAISDEVADQVRSVSDRLRAALGDLLIDIVPSYTSILLTYDINRVDRLGIRQRVLDALYSVDEGVTGAEPTRELVLPVYYGPEVALDMDDICAHSGLTPEQVIEIHTERLYRVYAIGFAPGFAYLGQVDDRIAMPRKQSPRTKVPARSLGIADNQTAIYPAQSPGGWQIIGRTPWSMIDFNSESLARVAVGDRVRFRSIDRDEFIALGGSPDEL